MIDAAKSKGIVTDFDMVGKKLGLQIIPISATKNIGVSDLIAFLEKGNFYSQNNENECQRQNEE